MELLNTVFQTVRIQFQKDEQQHTEKDQSRSPIAKEGQWNPNGRQQPDHHTNVDEIMKDQK